MVVGQFENNQPFVWPYTCVLHHRQRKSSIRVMKTAINIIAITLVMILVVEIGAGASNPYYAANRLEGLALIVGAIGFVAYTVNKKNKKKL